MKLIDIYKPIRRFSYPLIGLAAVAYLFMADWAESLAGNRLTLPLLALVIFAGVWLWLRPGKSTVQTAEDVFAAIGNGKPTLLNVFSNY